MVGMGNEVRVAEDIAFDDAGNLFVTDDPDDDLYRIDPATGAIVEVLDNNEADGLLVGGQPITSVKVEALGWDPLARKLIAADDIHAIFAELTFGNGNNFAIADLSSLDPPLEDVEGIDFVPVVEPGGAIELYDSEESLIGTFEIQSLGDNGFQSVDIDSANVSRMDIHLANGGAVSELAFSYENPNILLIENDQFVVDHRQSFVVPQQPVAISFALTNLRFDHSDQNSINDAVEAALVDTTHNPVVGTIALGSDAFFNLTEDQPPKMGGGAVCDEQNGIVSLDISHLEPGTEATLIVRLVNNDGVADNTARTTQVEIIPGVNFLTQSPLQTPTTATPIAAESRQHAIDFDRLTDVTTSGSINYSATTFNHETRNLFAEMTLTNDGSFSIREPLLLGVRNLSDPRVGVRDFDGVTPDGMPFYNLSDLPVDRPPEDRFHPGDSIADIEL